MDALVYEADEASELVKIAYPLELFDRNITDGKAMIVSFLTLTIGNNQGMGDVEYAKMHDFYVPPALPGAVRRPAPQHRRLLARPRPAGRWTAG